MGIRAFNEQLDLRIAQYDLLRHPFYQAWSAGCLVRDDLRAYAAEYFHQVDGFPACLRACADRLEDGPMRRAILSNLADEEGFDSQSGRRIRSYGSTLPRVWAPTVKPFGIRPAAPKSAI